MDESKPPRNPNYLVPCVFKAIRMIDALRDTPGRLSVEDFRSSTGYARTTIYRILRTLVACDYLVRDPGGYYRLNHALIPSKGRLLHANDRNMGFERWGVQFRDNGARVNAEIRKTQRGVPLAAELEEDRHDNL